MALVKPSQPKSTMVDTPEGLEVVVPARRNWFMTAFLGFWLIGWAWGEITVPAEFFKDGLPAGSKLFTVAWLLMWTLGGGAALFIFLWSLAGRERIRLGGGALLIRKEVLGVGRSREYDLSLVRNLRSAPPAYNPLDSRSSMQFWGIGGGLVRFDYGASTIRFGASFDESEAANVVERFKARYHFAESPAP